MKILLFLLLVLPAYSQVKVNYDKFNDRTIITSDGAHVDAFIDLTVKALHKGQTAEDVQYYLVFRSTSREWKFLRSHGLIFLVDGERFDFGPGTRDGEIATKYPVVHETMIYRIEREDLEKLANSSALEMKLGYVEAKFGPKDKKGMKEMLDYK